MEGGGSAVAAVEAEDELVEISLEMLGAQAVIDAQGPALEVGEDAVDPGEHEMARHRPDHMGIMARDRRTWIACPPIGLGGSAGCDAYLEEGMQAVGGIVGDAREADAAATSARHLDRPDSLRRQARRHRLDALCVGPAASVPSNTP